MSRPRRSEQERIENDFFDLTLKEQEQLLATLQTLHRLKRRQVPKPAEPVAEADSALKVVTS